MAILCKRCSARNPTLSKYCLNCASPLAVNLYEIDRLDEAGNATGSKIILFLCILYLLNITFGVDFLPDNLPLIGNFDEAGVSLLAVRAWMKIQDAKAFLRAQEIKAVYGPPSPQAGTIEKTSSSEAI